MLRITSDTPDVIPLSGKRPLLVGRPLYSQRSFALLPLVRKVVVQWHPARPIWVVE
jgi:hypothetical protein